MSQDHCPKTIVPRPLSQDHCPKTTVPRPLSQDHCPKTTVPRLYRPKAALSQDCTKTALAQDCPKTAPSQGCPKTILSQDRLKTALFQDRPQTALSQDFFRFVPRRSPSVWTVGFLLLRCRDFLNHCILYHHLSSSKNFPKNPLLMTKSFKYRPFFSISFSMFQAT